MTREQNEQDQKHDKGEIHQSIHRLAKMQDLARDLIGKKRESLEAATHQPGGVTVGIKENLTIAILLYDPEEDINNAIKGLLLKRPQVSLLKQRLRGLNMRQIQSQGCSNFRPT